MKNKTFNKWNAACWFYIVFCGFFCAGNAYAAQVLQWSTTADPAITALAKTKEVSLGVLSTEFDQVDLLSGQLNLTHTDVELPGNGALNLSVIRHYNSGTSWVPNTINPLGHGWSLHYGRVYRRGANTDNQMCNAQPSANFAQNLPIFEAQNGVRRIFYIVNTPEKKLLYHNANYISKDGWLAYCDSTSRGLLVKSPEGLTYHLTVPAKGIGQYGRGVYTRPVEWYASKIEDVHGNWIKIDYVQDNANRVLYEEGIKYPELVTTNDDRQLAFEYESPVSQQTGRLRLKKVTAKSANPEVSLQSVTYEYEATENASAEGFQDSLRAWRLKTVTLPNSTQWKYWHTGYSIRVDDLMVFNDVNTFTTRAEGYDAVIRQVTNPLGAWSTYQYAQKGGFIRSGSVYPPMCGVFGRDRMTAVVVEKNDSSGGKWLFKYWSAGRGRNLATANFIYKVNELGGRFLDEYVTSVETPHNVSLNYFFGEGTSSSLLLTQDGYQRVNAGQEWREGSLLRKRIYPAGTPINCHHVQDVYGTKGAIIYPGSDLNNYPAPSYDEAYEWAEQIFADGYDLY